MRRYNLKAIHNSDDDCRTIGLTVEDQCEGTIWKQFTTLTETQNNNINCWRPMRRYNLKAIHNARKSSARSVRTVEDQCEGTIWKQFTTVARVDIGGCQLLKTNAKVQFESNSQLRSIGFVLFWNCWRPMRRYNLKAIHNVRSDWINPNVTVEDQCEGTIWKQFTTKVVQWIHKHQLLKTNAKVQFESNSQPTGTTNRLHSNCWRPMRRYNLKAIHNQWYAWAIHCSTVEDQCEGTIWKQFTTAMYCSASYSGLLKTNAKVQFESNSQQVPPPPAGFKYCWRPMRRYNLKAIHNLTCAALAALVTVEDQCEGTIWKQFTTGTGNIRHDNKLLKTNAKVQFESNSQRQ